MRRTLGWTTPDDKSPSENNHTPCPSASVSERASTSTVTAAIAATLSESHHEPQKLLWTNRISKPSFQQSLTLVTHHPEHPMSRYSVAVNAGMEVRQSLQDKKTGIRTPHLEQSLLHVPQLLVEISNSLSLSRGPPSNATTNARLETTSGNRSQTNTRF